MKKIILLFTIAMLMMCGTACSDNSNSPDSQPQSSAEETVSSADPAPESKSDAESSDSLSQESTSEVSSSADPAPESKSDSESSESTDETALDVFIGELDGYDCAVAYVGYIENADVNSVRECAEKSLTVEKNSFVSDISDERIILAGGGEIYCIIPANTDAEVTVNSLDYDENGKEITGDELYSGDSAPILISCNVSDIMPNAAVSITNGENTAEFSPFLSLRDGRLALSEDMKILDFSEYEF